MLFIVGCVLALGPYLQFNGVNTFESTRPIPLPYILFRELPFMDINRFASRFVAVAMIGLSVLAAIGVAWLWERPWTRRLSVRGRGRCWP